VRGNNDDGPLAALPETLAVPMGELRAFVLHELGRPGRPSSWARHALARGRFDLVVHGHSHVPRVELRNGILYVNPGSAGPRRFHLPRTAAVLEVEGRRARVELRDLAGLELALFAPPFEASL
jgi:uncharacterized protein